MFSYRHGFHAGNHADVLKHVVQLQLMRYLCQKEAPLMMIDTHAGAGVYQLDSEYATKNAEFASGIGKLWNLSDMPAAVADYVELVKSFNPSGKMRHYPGSPYCADRVLRDQDRLRLFELHPSDGKLLRENMRKLEQHAAAQGKKPAGRGTRVMVQPEDGFAALKALLPPPSRRALVLIDPPYEDKRDYKFVVDALADALKRFATGTYAIWYPVLQRDESRKLPERLKKLTSGDWLHATLTIGAPVPDGVGLRGSGMFIFNPPWTLKATLQTTMPWLANRLSVDDGAGYLLETSDEPAPAVARPMRSS